MIAKLRYFRKPPFKLPRTKGGIKGGLGFIIFSNTFVDIRHYASINPISWYPKEFKHTLRDKSIFANEYNYIDRLEYHTSEPVEPLSQYHMARGSSGYIMRWLG